MATTLRLVFSSDDGKKITQSYPYADASATGEQVKSLMQTIIANKDIFMEQPEGIIGAEFAVETIVPVSVN